MGEKLLHILQAYICTNHACSKSLANCRYGVGDFSHPATLNNKVQAWSKLWSDCAASGRETVPTNLIDSF